MKKKPVILIALVIVIAIAASCASKMAVGSSHRYKARFDVAGICSNYTFSVIEGAIDPALVEATWTNPQTNKTYKNAFAVSNPCTFPSNLKQGASFYFEIIPEEKVQNCAVCMAYYPTPQKRLAIKVIQ